MRGRFAVAVAPVLVAGWLAAFALANAQTSQARDSSLADDAERGLVSGAKGQFLQVPPLSAVSSTMLGCSASRITVFRMTLLTSAALGPQGAVWTLCIKASKHPSPSSVWILSADLKQTCRHPASVREGGGRPDCARRRQAEPSLQLWAGESGDVAHVGGLPCVLQCPKDFKTQGDQTAGSDERGMLPTNAGAAGAASSVRVSSAPRIRSARADSPQSPTAHGRCLPAARWGPRHSAAASRASPAARRLWR
jgi:hypothetical protein